MIKEYHKDMRIISPCYINNMPADLYHAHDSASNSGLRLINRSPAHFKYAPEREATKSMTIGSALHMACLESMLFRDLYVSVEGDRRGKAYKEAIAVHGKEFVLLEDEMIKVRKMMESVHDNCIFSDTVLVASGCNELSGFSTDPETGVVCRHRFDKLTNDGIAIDLKTTTDARPEAFSKSIFTYGYHQQAAFYMDQYEWITGNKLEDFIFVVIESDAPYACKRYRIDQQSIDIGRDQYRKSLNLYAECKETGMWPAYENQSVEDISIPQWAINQHDFEQIESFTFTDD